MKKGIILLAVIIAAAAVVTGCGAQNNSTAATTAPVATADTASKGELTEAEAKAAALKDANIPESEATFVKAVKKTEDGFTYFEIEFTTATKKYTYKILTTNGTIKDRKVESYSGGAAGDTSGSKITEAEATAAALAIAELSESDVSGLKATLTTEDGTPVYKVAFTSDGEEFEYLINASTGDLYEAESESADNDNDSDNDNDGDSDDNDDDSDDNDSDEDNDDSNDSDNDNNSDDNNNDNNNND